MKCMKMISFQEDLHPPCLQPEGVIGRTWKLFFIYKSKPLSTLSTGIEVENVALEPLRYFCDE